MLTIKQQTAARGSSTSPQAGQKPLPLSERSQPKSRFAVAVALIWIIMTKMKMV
jgi:hypothetical protein